MDDLHIIQLYFNRSENAISETEAKYGKLCLHIARNILADESDSEECVNDTYLSLWNSIPPLRPDNLKAFISRVTRNIALKRLRYNTALKRSKEMEISLTELEAVLPSDDLQPGLDEQQLGRLINDFLQTVALDCRNVFLRRYWYFDSVADIAARYAFSTSKVKSMLFQTRNKLREYLSKEGITL